MKQALNMTEDERDRAWSDDWRKGHKPLRLVQLIGRHEYDIRYSVWTANRKYYTTQELREIER